MSEDQRAPALRPRATPGVPLATLLASLPAPSAPAAPLPPDPSAPAVPAQHVLVTGATLDSRLVAPGDLYVALPGRSQHGARFAAQAVQAGAVAVLTDPAGARLASAVDAPVLVVSDPRTAMAGVSARIYGEPASRMTMYAITGTNGKTTTSFLLEAALRALSRRTGVIGTIGYRLDGSPLPATRTTVTTPESPELQALLAVLVEGGVQACVMEVSSHALALNRTDAITFHVAAFTNLGRDHLDFHGDVESYFEAKARLFTPEHTRRAVVNVDDPRGRVLVDRLGAAGVPVATVSLNDATAHYYVTGTELDVDGLTSVQLQTPGRPVEFRLGLPGAYNVRNAITALAMIEQAEPDADLQRAASGLAAALVPGRMQRVDLGRHAPSVYVDFAHTPQAVAASLGAVVGRHRIAVLGCGGDRDADKREPMGAAAARSAEVVLVTDDNPRSEDPAAIRRQVLRGARQAKQAEGLATEIADGTDRRSAIRRALRLAAADDVLVILGKGHEAGQEVAGVLKPFDDVEVVRDEWDQLARAGVPR